MRCVRRLPRPVRRHLPGLRAQGRLERVRRWLHVQPVLAHRRGRQRQQADLGRPVLHGQLHAGPGHAPQEEPEVVRPEGEAQLDRLQDHHRHQLGDPGDEGWRGRRDHPVPGDRSVAARASEEPGVQRCAELHPGALGHRGQSCVQRAVALEPAAGEAVHPAGHLGGHEPAVADQGAVRLDRPRPEAAEQPGVRDRHERHRQVRVLQRSTTSTRRTRSRSSSRTVAPAVLRRRAPATPRSGRVAVRRPSSASTRRPERRVSRAARSSSSS